MHRTSGPPAAAALRHRGTGAALLPTAVLGLGLLWAPDPAGAAGPRAASDAAAPMFAQQATRAGDAADARASLPAPPLAPTLQRWRLASGHLTLRWNLDLTAAIGLKPERAALRLPLSRKHPLSFDAPFRQVRALLGGEAARFDGYGVTLRGERIELAAIVSRSGARRELALVDVAGREWFRVDKLMAVFDGSRFAVLTADVRLAPRLAEALGAAALDGLAVGELSLEATAVALDPDPAASKSCAVPNWPNRNGFVADVLLEAISVQSMRCRRSSGMSGCDGPGPDDGEVVLAPNALLRNADTPTTADVPWYPQFAGPPSQPPFDYPYLGHDQHPYLVWNLYRIDASGRIEQIGRSGLKQAFATANDDCSDPTCAGNFQILGRGCADVYSVSSNDAGFFLSPRREVIPARGQWGRCGSAHDDLDDDPADGLAGCDGQQDAPPDDFWRDRMRVREHQIDPARNPGARWLFEAWYVVRDDVDIWNTMGHVEIAPAFLPVAGIWVTPTERGFRRGSALDAWVAPDGADPNARASTLVTPEGHARLAVRVTRLGNVWRYDYALANYDFSRPVTENAEPNLRVIRNLGFGRAALPYPATALEPLLEFADGNDDESDDWHAARDSAQVAWRAPAGRALDWGAMVRLSVVSDRPPAETVMTLDVAEAGQPASYSIATLGPDSGGRLLLAGFEDGETP